MAYTSHKRGTEHLEHSWVSKLPFYMKNGMEAISVAKSAFDVGKQYILDFRQSLHTYSLEPH
eukprot:12324976-Prorocentrum_lima.AAC.1